MGTFEAEKKQTRASLLTIQMMKGKLKKKQELWSLISSKSQETVLCGKRQTTASIIEQC